MTSKPSAKEIESAELRTRSTRPPRNGEQHDRNDGGCDPVLEVDAGAARLEAGKKARERARRHEPLDDRNDCEDQSQNDCCGTHFKSSPPGLGAYTIAQNRPQYQNSWLVFRAAAKRGNGRDKPGMTIRIAGLKLASHSRRASTAPVQTRGRNARMSGRTDHRSA